MESNNACPAAQGELGSAHSSRVCLLDRPSKREGRAVLTTMHGAKAVCSHLQCLGRDRGFSCVQRSGTKPQEVCQTG